MLLFLVSCFTFIILFKFSFFKHLLRTSIKAGVTTSKTQTLDKTNNKDSLCLLDLPELPLECILEKLSPSGLASMSGVCRSFRAMCTQDHLWKKHLNHKWSKFLIGNSMHQEWQAYIHTKKKQTFMVSSNGKGYFGVFTTWWKEYLKFNNTSICLPIESVMFWYLSLESGSFSFPAQVYNREHGNVGFLLSCYDAKVSYDAHTDSFNARYLAHGDHFEIQWRKSKEFPYGWWYGVVGHLESCDGNKLYCQCHLSERVILEFKQYKIESRWRKTIINRKDHREVGNETDGFDAGIRKLYSDREIMTWKGLWPAQQLD
ncbi:putative F-box domain-containing protein [Helianthus debilis subsp. tardiflorus]